MKEEHGYLFQRAIKLINSSGHCKRNDVTRLLGKPVTSLETV